MCLVLLAGYASGGRYRLAEPAVVAAVALQGGGPLDYLKAEAEDALVHLRVYVQGEEKPRPGTAFIVGRSGHKVYLLTAWHVLHPLAGRATVTSVEWRGHGVKGGATEQPRNLEVHGASSQDDDLLLLQVDGQPAARVLPLAHAESELVGSVTALGYSKAADQGPLPMPTSVTGSVSPSRREGRTVLITNAAIDPGMSGGPVLSASWVVIGVVRGEAYDGNPVGLVAPVWLLAEALKTHAGIELRRQRAPFGLPSMPAPLLERPEEAAIHRALEARAGAAPHVLLVGAAGMGKTVLAAKVAWDGLGRGRYPDGVYFLVVKDRPAAQVLEELAAALGAPLSQQRVSGTSAELAGLVHRTLAGRRTLVVLDDVRDAEVLRELGPALAAVPVLLTARTRYSAPELTRVVEIGSLPPAQAQRLVREGLRARGQAADPAQVKELCQRLGHHALALSLAVGALYGARITVPGLLERLDKGGLSALDDTEKDVARRIRVTLKLSFDELGAQEREVLLALGQLGEAPVWEGLLEVALGKGGWRGAMDLLVQRSVADRGQEDELVLHPLVYLFAQEQGNELPSAAALRQRVEEWFLRADTPEDHPERWRPALAQHLQRAQRLAQPRPAVVRDLVLRWEDALDRFGAWAALKALWEQYVAAARARKDSQDVAMGLLQLGIVTMNLGEYASANRSLDDSRAQYEMLGDDAGVAESLIKLGHIAQLTGKVKIAKDLYNKSQKYYSKARDLAGVASALLGLGMVAQDTRDYAGARDFYKRSRALFRDKKDRDGLCRVLHQQGRLAELTSDYPGAQRLYGESLTVCRELGNHDGESTDLCSIGLFEEKQSRPGNAERALSEGLAIMRARQVINRNLGEILWGLARVAQQQRHYGQALSCAQEAASVLHKLNDPYARGVDHLVRALTSLQPETNQPSGAPSPCRP